jgi:hypothetical protein
MGYSTEKRSWEEGYMVIQGTVQELGGGIHGDMGYSTEELGEGIHISVIHLIQLVLQRYICMY